MSGLTTFCAFTTKITVGSFIFGLLQLLPRRICCWFEYVSVFHEVIIEACHIWDFCSRNRIPDKAISLRGVYTKNNRVFCGSFFGLRMLQFMVSLFYWFRISNSASAKEGAVEGSSVSDLVISLSVSNSHLTPHLLCRANSFNLWILLSLVWYLVIFLVRPLFMQFCVIGN